MRVKRVFSLINIVIVLGLLTITAYAEDFSDVPDNYPYKEAIDFCKAQGFIKGTSDTTFSPEDKLTRAQYALIWSRCLLLHETNPNFSDMTYLEKYYDTSVILMYGLGIMNGTSESQFSPGGKLTREQLAMITARTLRLGVANQDDFTRYVDSALISDWARDAVSACINANILSGLYDGQYFEPQRPVTRAQVCKLIYNIEVPPS